MAIDKKQIGIGLLSGVVIGAATLGTIGVSAQEAGSDTFLDRVSDKFGIEKTELEAEREAFREEKKEERQAERAEHLSSLVSDGVLTQDQADDLTALKDEFKAEAEALKEAGDVTRAEFKELFEANRAEVEAWAEENGVELDDIKPEKGGRKGHRHGHGFGPHGGNDTEAGDVEVEPTSTL